jgi:RNA polymerase sigma factor (sigma-70 family)
MDPRSGDSNSRKQPDDFEILLARIRNGDETASAELVQRYERPVLRAVRARLSNRMRRVLDSMDVMQSVNRSLLLGLRSQKFQFVQPAQLIALAVLLVQRKVARHWRRMKGTPLGEDVIQSDGFPMHEVESHEPEQSSVIAAEDLLQRFLSRLDGLDRQLVQLRLDGNSSIEVAALLNLDAAFVRMRWARLRNNLRGSGLVESGVSQRRS